MSFGDSDDVGGELLLDSPSALRTVAKRDRRSFPESPAIVSCCGAIEYRDLEMPPDEKLPDEVIADFRRWIELGAPDPREDSPLGPDNSGPDQPATTRSAAGRSLVDQARSAGRSLPAVDDASWVRTDVDRFILARLEAAGLRPNPDADPATLLRRVHFDLIGLPPETSRG